MNDFHRTEHQLVKAIAKAHRKHSKLTIEAVREIRASNETGIALGKKFGVSNSMIGMIRRGKSWKEPTPWAL